MKVAVPTNDGLTITDNFECAGAFLVMTFKGGEMIKEELRKLRFSEIINFEESFQEKVKDCQYVFYREIEEDSSNELKELEIKGIITPEKLIGKIADQCKEETFAKVSVNVLAQNRRHLNK
jgi:hypothetical protein